jgi:hypothetical protein
MQPKPSAHRVDDRHIRFSVGGIELGFTILTNEQAEILRNALTAALDERNTATRE